MLSETPARMAISRGPADVRTSLTISGGNRLCSCRGALSVCTVHASFMFLTLAGLMSVSCCCHEVRALSAPSISQFALAALCGAWAPGTVVHAAAAHSATAEAQKVRFIGLRLLLQRA